MFVDQSRSPDAHLLSSSTARIAAIACVAISLVFSATTRLHAQAAVDLVFVIDESTSMGFAHDWIADMVTDLETALQTSGVGNSVANRYALTGFGSFEEGHGTGQLAHKHEVAGADWGTAAELSAATAGLSIVGTTEDGWEALNFVIDNYSYRSSPLIKRNLVLITNEDRDELDDTLTFEGTRDKIGAAGGVLNSVISNDFLYGDSVFNTALGIDDLANAYVADGAGDFTVEPDGKSRDADNSSYQDYGVMALQLGGAAWDLGELQRGGLPATSFSKAFVAVKTEEVAEPGTIKVFKFHDIERDGGFDEGVDSGLADWQFRVDGPDSFSAVITTGVDGLASLEGLPEGEYLISEMEQFEWVPTTPLTQSVDVAPGIASVAQFGNAPAVVIPEPSGLFLAACGLLAVVAFAWRRRRSGV